MYLYYMFKWLIEKIGSVLMTKLKNRVILSEYAVLNNEHNLISDSNCNQLLFLEFSSNLSFILWKIPTIVLVLCKGHSYECNCFAQLIGYVYSLFWSGGVNIWVAWELGGLEMWLYGPLLNLPNKKWCSPLSSYF